MLKIGEIEGIASLTKDHVFEDELDLHKTKSIGTKLREDANRFTSGDQHKEQMLTQMCLDLTLKLPEAFELIEVRTCFPIKRNESLNTVI
jgi:hypothetical protein